MINEFNYEYVVVDPVTKGRYLLRTRRPKIRDQIEFHIRLALLNKKRAGRNEQVVLYASE